MKLQKSDRVLLMLLAFALACFALYSWGTSGPSAKEATAPLALVSSDTVKVAKADTIPLPEKPLSPGTDEKKTKGGILTTERYPGPPEWMKDGAKADKLSAGETIDLNKADTLMLQRVPGIGPAFARRIYKYRERLGGYFVREQLQEVYGMDRERYDQIKPFFEVKTPPRRIYLSPDSIGRHPYLSFRQMDVLKRHLLKGDTLTWPLLMKSKAFLRDDSLRLAPYLALPR